MTQRPGDFARTQREIGEFVELSQVRVCKIIQRDKDLPTPRVLRPNIAGALYCWYDMDGRNRLWR